jgi:Tol biopolymer transport system component
MKRKKNNSIRASALRISLSVTLISVSVILLAIAAPNNTRKPPRQVTTTSQSSGVATSGTFAPAIATPSPTPCSKIAFGSTRDGNNEIYIMDADGSNQTRLTNNPATDLLPSFRKDGSKIAFQSDRDGNVEIYVMDANGSNQTRLTNNSARDSEPSFSPDGSKIVFESNRDGTSQIYVMNSDGSNPIQLTSTSGSNSEPSFSPDGSKIAFVSGRDGEGDIYVMNADGSNQTRLTSNSVANGTPSFSPDSSKIAFSSLRDGNFEIYIMDANGSNQTNLTRNLANDSGTSFSPDGKIAFQSDRDGNGEVYVMNADGSNQTRLTNNPASDGAPSFSGCSSTVLIGLEVTQGVQDLNNSVPLVEQKKTFVRAHVKNLSVNPIFASASLTAKDTATGDILGTIPNSNVGGQIAIPRNPSRASLNDSFLFEVPFAWRRETVEFSFAGNELPFACEAGGDECSKVTVTFQPVDPLSMKFVQLTYKDAAGIDHTPTQADLTRVMKEFLGRYPISYLDTVTQATRTNFDACLGSSVAPNMRKELNDLRNSDCRSGPCKDFYQGLLADQAACNPPTTHNGEGDLPGHASAVFVTTDDTTPRIHEQGHVMGFKHTTYTGGEICEDFFGFQTPCTQLEGGGTLSLSKEPYALDTVYGFDVNNSSPQKIYPAETADFMSYGRPRWPSRVNYGLLFEQFALSASPGADVKLKQNGVLANQSVIIDGIIQFDGPTGQIGSVIVNTTPATITLPSPGEYSIRLENSQGTELARYSFNPDRGSENLSAGIISLLLPWDANARRIVLLHNEDVIDSREASANSPTVNVTFPNGGEVLSEPSATFTWTAADSDGDVLSYTLEYSADNGTTWETLAINWNSESFTVDVTKLHGSNQALARVTASDGFNCAQTQSLGTFSVPDHAPTADVSSPEDNRLYVGEQMIILEGTGSDVEDGALDGSRLAWTSDLNGPLGTGTSLAINAMTLQEGTHTITLTATDSTNHAGNASISISIFRARPALPATLSVSPVELTFRLTPGQTATQTLAIRNEGDGDLEWSAGADQPWIHLESASGSTPYNLDIMVDATGLTLGEYSGQVTIDAPGAVGSPQVVTVNLIVQPEPSPTPTATATATPTATATATPTPTPSVTPTVTPTPTPGPITLSVEKRKVRGINTVRLTWSGATSANIDVYRNGRPPLATVPNTGSYTDSTGDTGRARYRYRVCEAGTSICSNNATVTFGGPPP